MPSAMEHPEVVACYLGEEGKAGRLLGPFWPKQIPGLQVSGFRVVPKGRNTGKWRLITDLSFPKDYSINDGIDPTLCTLQYTSINKIARAAHQVGSRALLAKADIKSAYRLVSVHLEDRLLLDVEWEGFHYIDKMLPLGLHSAPKIFAVADALEWCIRQRRVTGINYYLDDFVIVAPPASDMCRRYLGLMQEEFDILGVPLVPEKTEWPTMCLTFLRIEVDTVMGRLHLPQEKLAHLQQEVSLWLGRKSC